MDTLTILLCIILWEYGTYIDFDDMHICKISMQIDFASLSHQKCQMAIEIEIELIWNGLRFVFTHEMLKEIEIKLNSN